MKREDILKLRDLVSITVENLISVTADVEKEVIVVVNICSSKEIELPIAELQSHKYSCRDFITYLKDKLK